MTSNNSTVNCFICERPLRHTGVDFTGKNIYRCDDCIYAMTPVAPAEAAARLYDDPQYFDGWSCNRELDSDRFDPAVHRQVEQYLEFIKTHTTGKSLLDVGTGSGLLPQRARESGYEVEGTDLSKHVGQTLPAKGGFRVHQGTLEEIKFDRKYDVITLLHVLEHTSNPLETLQRAREILTGEGYVVVVVPNVRSLDTRLKDLLSGYKLKSRPYKHLALGHHNFVFSINSLKKLGQAAHFDVVHHATTQPAWRAGALHRVLQRWELAAWCWVVYRKRQRPIKS